jgi:hypothetical protein
VLYEKFLVHLVNPICHYSMQNRYVGDINDFGKYGLLKNLCKDPGLQLGVNWYLVSDEHAAKENNNDGQQIRYAPFKNTDISLYSRLQDIIATGNRYIGEVEKGDVLPRGTLFYNKPLPAEPFERDEWFNNSLNCLQESSIIFCDPDNGLEITTCSKYHPAKAPKYIFIDEIKEIYRAGKSVVIYQHSGRMGTHDDQIKKRKQQLLKAIRITQSDLIRVIKSRGVYFLIIIQRAHSDIIQDRLTGIKEGPWKTILELQDV